MKFSWWIFCNLEVFRHHREMQEVINEPTNKYPDVFVRNLAQKHMEDKQVDRTNDQSTAIADTG